MVIGNGLSEDLRHALLGILDEAMKVGAACCGSVQVYDSAGDALQLVACRGFAAAATAHFQKVGVAEGTTCARAWRARRRISVPLLAEDPQFAPYLPMAELCGFRAVQSTPLPGRTQPVGVMSTHFAGPHYPSTAEMVLLDHYAERAARAIEDFAATG